MQVQILIDNIDSWIVPYAHELVDDLLLAGHYAVLVHEHDDVVTGDILCILSCERLFKSLNLNKHNLVVHESNLPSGKGWSPVTWQVLEGKNEIPVTLFEATDKLDGGQIYKQDFIKLNGHELLPEIKHQQGLISKRLIMDFINEYPNNFYKSQVGVSTFYRKRTSKDSELDLGKTLEEQFNLLRVCDNERYPAFFMRDGIKYIIKIEKYNE